jgi:NADH-quinone oxidoreductase subunit L
VAGAGVAWWIYGARRAAAPRARPVRALLEHKLYFDQAYDRLFYRPAVWAANGFAAFVERPLIAGSISGVTVGARRLAGEVSQLQTGLVRTYAFAVAGSVTVLVLVFVWVK